MILFDLNDFGAIRIMNEVESVAARRLKPKNRVPFVVLENKVTILVLLSIHILRCFDQMGRKNQILPSRISQAQS